MALQLPAFLRESFGDPSMTDQLPWQIILSAIGTLLAVYLTLRSTILKGEDESPVDIVVPVPEQAKNGGRWVKGTGEVWEGKGLKVW